MLQVIAVSTFLFFVTWIFGPFSLLVFGIVIGLRTNTSEKQISGEITSIGYENVALGLLNLSIAFVSYMLLSIFLVNPDSFKFLSYFSNLPVIATSWDKAFYTTVNKESTYNPIYAVYIVSCGGAAVLMSLLYVNRQNYFTKMQKITKGYPSWPWLVLFVPVGLLATYGFYGYSPLLSANRWGGVKVMLTANLTWLFPCGLAVVLAHLVARTRN